MTALSITSLDRRRRRRPTKSRRLLGVVIASVLAVTGSVVLTASADAVTGYHVVVGSAGLNAHNGPGTGYAVVGGLSNGQAIDISCQTKGTLVGVGLPGTPTDVWDRLTNGWYITDYYTSTPGLAGGYTAGIPQCGVASPPPPPAPRSIYNRTAAANWAVNNWDNSNGSLLFYRGDDCTYFVSEALWAGDLPKTADWTNTSRDPSKLLWAHVWNPGPTKDATDADMFKNYVVNSGIATIKEISWSDNTAGGAQLGDIIGYDWGPANGILDHLAIVTSFTPQKYPEVSQHSNPQTKRYWSWSVEKKKWIQLAFPGSRVYLIHIIK